MYNNLAPSYKAPVLTLRVASVKQSQDKRLEWHNILVLVGFSALRPRQESRLGFMDLPLHRFVAELPNRIDSRAGDTCFEKPIRIKPGRLVTAGKRRSQATTAACLQRARTASASLLGVLWMLPGFNLRPSSHDMSMAFTGELF